ncbi:3-oxoacyl-[acyl-carrier protein] reductase [Kaistia soli DSM 19436]|uniref:3-oxoacyl-[acyl-carrier protein] reductase n=1 Tax=Kaistia soli DSM 19436 TaxID=1122133 RepID=A0A1M5EB41_9HYPH|nr:SDR family oxidoreductase [Kaistia soli]SHF76406.1 3-oxoacyl-[acyl-carrier protein] reductase [Kaistia soli DSM 19436]
MSDLSGKVAIVTGGGGGIGAASASAMASRGAAVVVADVNLAAAERSADVIRANGGEALAVAADVSQRTQVEALVDAALERFGRLDILFNNAGIQYDKSMEDTSEEEWDRLFAINVKGMFLCSKAVIPALERQGGGVILNCASVASFRPLMGMNTAYVASKGAVMAMTRDMAVALAPRNIRVLALCPGPTRTPITADSIARGVITEEEVRALQLTDRIAEPAEIGEIAAYLVSPAARYFVGTGVVADGGMCIT